MSTQPELRFPDFTQEYEHKTIKDIATICLGLTYTPDYVEEGVIFISSKDIANDYLDLTDVKYISQEEFDNSTSNAKPQRGDILFTRVGSNLGHPVIVETDIPLCMFVSLGFLRITDENVSNEYVKHWMNTDSFWNQIKRKTAGGAKVNINTGWLKDFDIFLPPIEEQNKVAQMLNKMDELITTMTKEIEELVIIRSGVVQGIFCQEIKVDGDYADWEEDEISNYIEEYTVKTTTNNEYPILSSTKNGIVLQSEYFNKQTASTDTTGYKIVPNGYFTYRSMSDTGDFYFNQQNLIDAGIVSPAYPVFKATNIDSQYLYYMLNESDYIKSQILLLKEGGTRFALSMQKLKKLTLLVPTSEEQQKIVECIASFDKLLEIKKQKLATCKEIKQGLLQKMFV